MTTLFRLDASIRSQGSVTRAVADTLQTALQDDQSHLDVVRRDVGLEPVDPRAWAEATFSAHVPVDRRSPTQTTALASATRLADEVTAADVLLFAVPLYNWGVSQHFKAWFDLVATDPRLTPISQTPAIAGRPAFLVTARGGGAGPGSPREGWDHASGWMRRVLEDVWRLDLQVIETELTLAEQVPAMAGLRDQAGRLLETAHLTAWTAGRSISARTRSVA